MKSIEKVSNNLHQIAFAKGNLFLLLLRASSSESDASLILVLLVAATIERTHANITSKSTTFTSLNIIIPFKLSLSMNEFSKPKIFDDRTRALPLVVPADESQLKSSKFVKGLLYFSFDFIFVCFIFHMRPDTIRFRLISARDE